MNLEEQIKCIAGSVVGPASLLKEKSDRASFHNIGDTLFVRVQPFGELTLIEKNDKNHYSYDGSDYLELTVTSKNKLIFVIEQNKSPATKRGF